MMLPPPLPPSVRGEDNARSTNANSSPTALAYAVCRALKACVLSDRPLLAGPAGGKMAKAMAATMMVMLTVEAES